MIHKKAKQKNYHGVAISRIKTREKHNQSVLYERACKLMGINPDSNPNYPEGRPDR